MAIKVLILLLTIVVKVSHAYNVLLATMGGTRSHTVPFVALGTALIQRGHNVTLVSGFPGPAANNGLKELVPSKLESYIGNYTSEWDLVGSRFRNELPLSPWDAMRYGWEACEALLTDKFYLSEVQQPEGNPQARWDVVVIDGAYPECLLGVLHGQQVPTIMLNTVALYSGSIARQGNPSPWAIRPYFGKALTQDMNLMQRILNVGYLSVLEIMHWIMTTGFIQPTLRKHLGTMCILLIIVLSTYIGISLSVPVNHFTKGSDALEFAPLIDGHNDLPFSIYSILNNQLQEFDFKRNLTNDPIWGTNVCKTCKTDFPRLKAGKIGAQFWSAYASCKSQYKDAVELTMRSIDVIKRLVQTYSDVLESVTEADDIENVWKKGKIGSMIGVEGGHSINSNLAVLRLYYELGVRYMTLTHSCNTPWADASPMNDEFVNNLTTFGKEIVWEMNRLGMLVDLSHVSHNVMRHVLAVTKSPVIFSHSSAFSVCNNYRNVPDDVLHQVKENNGIVMVNFYSVFVNCDKAKNATLEDVVAHINYIKNLIGVDHVGIGGDYDGVSSTPEGLEDVSKYPTLFDRLYENRDGEPKWNREDLEKLAGRNLIRVFKEAESVRDSLKSQPPREIIIDVENIKEAQKRKNMTLGLDACQTSKEFTDWENHFAHQKIL